MRKIWDNELLKSTFSSKIRNILQEKFKNSYFEFGRLQSIPSMGRENLNNFITKNKMIIKDTRFTILRHKYIIEMPNPLL